MGICNSKTQSSSFPQHISEYIRLQHQSSSPVVLVRLEHNNEAAMDEVVAVMTRSFAGRHGLRPAEAMYDWAIGPEFPLDDPSCKNKRLEFTGYYIRWCVVACLAYGIVLVAKDRSGSGNGRVVGAVCALTPENGYVCDFTDFLRPHMWRILSKMRWKPPPDILGPEPTRRFEIFGSTMKPVHDAAWRASRASNADGKPPWYVFALGTDVDAQGKGYGSALLAAIHHLADRDGADTMLEYSGEVKRRFYCGKHGYEDFGEEVLLSDPKRDRNGYDRTVPGIAAIRSRREPTPPS
mmetsp:Transcript_12997/g.30665  ORF Transcript_12997/g.30665 Transcript_12997/m.30665 type:complete len:294 (-) Transcript_12997:336-1217(-)